MAVKCKINMTHKILPVDGSVKGPDGKTTGTCPDCETPGVMLSIVGGYIRAHEVAASEIPANNPQAPTLVPPARSHPHGSDKVSTGLSEPQVELTDTGVREGDPRAAERRRVVDLHAAQGTGTVQVPRKVEGKGRTKSGAPRMTTKLVDVDATPETVREALDYWKGRTPRTPQAHTKQAETLADLNRWLRAMDAGAVRLDAMVDTAQAHRGPTLVKGRDTVPRLRDPGLSWEEGTDLRQDGTVRKSTTLDEPLGRERFDPKITRVPVPAPRLTASQRRAGRRKTQRNRLYAASQARTDS